MSDTLLNLKNLKVIFPANQGIVKVVEGIDIEIK
jgi:ABC-type dipeptide/oligopeptide/nickel transport system ATPase component